MNSRSLTTVFSLLVSLLTLFSSNIFAQSFDNAVFSPSASAPTIRGFADMNPLVQDQASARNNNSAPLRDYPVEGKWLLLQDAFSYGWGPTSVIFDASSVDYDIVTDPTLLSSIDLYEYDVIWIRDYASDSWNSTYNLYRSYVDQWVEDGGCLYSSSGTNYFSVKQIHPGGLTYYASGFVNTSYTAAEQDDCLLFDLLDWDLNHTNTGTYFSHTYYDLGEVSSASNGDVQQLVTSAPNGGGLNIIVRYGYGNGQVVVSGTTDGAAFNWGGFFTWNDVRHEIFHYLYSLSNVTRPEITVSPLSLDFGTIEFGRSSTLEVEVCNDGTGDLIVSSVSVSNPDYDCDDTDFTLSPGECRVIEVTFTGSSVGVSSGSLEISSNDRDEGVVVVDFSSSVVWVPSSVLLARLCDEVCDLHDDGYLNRGQKNSLCVKLENAIRALGRNQAHVARNNLNAFVNEVRALIQGGVLSSLHGQPLIDEALFISSLIAQYGVASESGAIVENIAIPTSVSISGTFPNPFNSTAGISFGLPENGLVNVSVFDLSGRQVRSLYSGQLNAGYHTVAFDAQNLNTGVYLVRLSALGQTEVARMTLIK